MNIIHICEALNIVYDFKIISVRQFSHAHVDVVFKISNRKSEEELTTSLILYFSDDLFNLIFNFTDIPYC